MRLSDGGFWSKDPSMLPGAVSRRCSSALVISYLDCEKATSRPDDVERKAVGLEELTGMRLVRVGRRQFYSGTAGDSKRHTQGRRWPWPLVCSSARRRQSLRHIGLQPKQLATL